MKPLPTEQLPPGTFLPKNTYDPLRRNTQDFFWYHVGPYFDPICAEDLSALQCKPAQVPLLLRNSCTSTPLVAHEQTIGKIRSFPLCQRLTAALLDEGKGQTVAAKPVRTGLTPEPTWLGPAPHALNEYNELMEHRLRLDLLHLGLLDPEENEQLLTQLRLSNWRLQNLNAQNATLTSQAFGRIRSHLDTQAIERREKTEDNHVEVKYLKAMAEKSGKRGKGRFNRLLNQIHPFRHLNPGDPINQQAKASHNSVADKGISKRRKRKAVSSDRPAQKRADKKTISAIDANDTLAPHIADIIWKHNNAASLDDIVKDFVERVPNFALDAKDARVRIENCMSSSRNTYRFEKMASGFTYSASKV